MYYYFIFIILLTVLKTNKFRRIFRYFVDFTNIDVKRQLFLSQQQQPIEIVVALKSIESQSVACFRQQQLTDS